jgi:hypothetical protein
LTYAFTIESIIEAAPSRRPGYVDACLASGEAFKTEQGVDMVRFTEAAYAALRAQFGLNGEGHCPECGK